MKNIKMFFDPIVDFSVRRRGLWYPLKTFIKLAEWFRFRRSLYELKLVSKEHEVFFAKREVLSGFFKGLKYPSLLSLGSSLPPKLLGSYEAELFPVFEMLKHNSYTEIVDIGCAEGYYAVGLAIHFPNTKVFAFDIDNKATEICKKMASLNNVGDRVIIDELCTSITLKEFNFSGKGLIICDCEGYERELFTKDNVKNLVNCDLIVELHPQYHRDIKEYLTTLFSPTHDISLITSQDDDRKLFDFQDKISGLSDLGKLRAVQEGRSFSMFWMILISNCK